MEDLVVDGGMMRKWTRGDGRDSTSSLSGSHKHSYESRGSIKSYELLFFVSVQRLFLWPALTHSSLVGYTVLRLINFVLIYILVYLKLQNVNFFILIFF
jgi:hypothetical protein